MKDVHVVVQVFDDLSVVLEEADGHIFVGRQAVRDRLKLPENLVQSALPVFIVPPENTDGGKTDGKVCVRVGGNSLLQESEILLEDRIDLLDGSLVLEKACGRVPFHHLIRAEGLGLIPAVGISFVVVQHKGVGKLQGDLFEQHVLVPEIFDVVKRVFVGEKIGIAPGEGGGGIAFHGEQIQEIEHLLQFMAFIGSVQVPEKIRIAAPGADGLYEGHAEVLGKLSDVVVLGDTGAQNQALVVKVIQSARHFVVPFLQHCLQTRQGAVVVVEGVQKQDDSGDEKQEKPQSQGKALYELFGLTGFIHRIDPSLMISFGRVRERQNRIPKGLLEIKVQEGADLSQGDQCPACEHHQKQGEGAGKALLLLGGQELLRIFSVQYKGSDGQQHEHHCGTEVIHQIGILQFQKLHRNVQL